MYKFAAKFLFAFIFLGLSIPVFFISASTTDGTINAVYKYAWSENLGWLNLGTSGGNVHVTDTALTGYIWSTEYGWINLNPSANTNVTNDGAGNLSGYAFGQNCGWINFNGVKIDSSGNFSGNASGSISGDISFNCLNCIVKTDWRPQNVRTCTSWIYSDWSGCSNGQQTRTIISSLPSGCSGGGPTLSQSCSSDNNNGGGGGGGGVVITQQVIFSGRAYPLSKVTVLKDGQIAVSTIAGLDATFNTSLANLSSGNYTFNVFSEDSQGRRSNSFTFPVTITSGTTATISGIFLSPTIDVDKTEVKRGDTITIFGQSAPASDINITVNSSNELFEQTKADKNGVYLYDLDTAPLEMGQHSTQSKSSLAGLTTSYSLAVNFQVGTKTVSKNPIKCPIKGDLNNDCKVNLIDFSIAAYWYKRPLSDAFKTIEKTELSSDGKITLVDFSIMAYYWTG